MSPLRRAAWWVLRRVHGPDYAWVLPALARLPLALGWRLAALRGWINGWLGRDWRSVALGTAHVRRRTLQGLALLAPQAGEAQRQRWCRQRFAVESRDEFEAARLDARGLRGLSCTLDAAAQSLLQRPPDRGLVLLTPHFDSFYLGIAFLAQAGSRPVGSMASAVFRDPRVDPAVTRHFQRKYAALERQLRGGRVPEMESGLRPFYRVLQQAQVLVVLADAPVLPNGVAMTVDFLGGPRQLAGGALRLAQATGSEIGGFVCRCVGPGRYALQG
ncbi:MAG: hypothetical protein FGM55_16440, partial [Rhodoferax sp.]|nr:hypothetical protein [Rhodoferax sp.]